MCKITVLTFAVFDIASEFQRTQGPIVATRGKLCGIRNDHSWIVWLDRWWDVESWCRHSQIRFGEWCECRHDRNEQVVDLFSEPAASFQTPLT